LVVRGTFRSSFLDHLLCVGVPVRRAWAIWGGGLESQSNADSAGKFSKLAIWSAWKWKEPFDQEVCSTKNGKTVFACFAWTALWIMGIKHLTWLDGLREILDGYFCDWDKGFFFLIPHKNFDQSCALVCPSSNYFCVTCDYIRSLSSSSSSIAIILNSNSQ
jgi:hypothetical protein